METTATHIDVYQIITNRIVEQLAQHVVPWQRPWTEGGHPQNLFTKRPYSGINTWLLASLGYQQNYFLTWKQIKAVGGSVRKGEKGTMVVFWKKAPEPQSAESADATRQKAVLRYYFVFNVAQVENLLEVVTIPYPEHAISRLNSCEEIVERMPNCPPIRHGKQRAYYSPEKDYVNVPPQGSFSSAESYYCTLFHELIHSTGHSSRLARKEVMEHQAFGSEPYGIEELTAEIGACYLNSVAGIENKEFDNSLAYIKGWIERLRNDKRMIVYASGQAQKATDFILNVPSAQRSMEERDLVSET